jgi:hypothetical protein
MIEGTPQLLVDLLLRFNPDALTFNDLEYARYFLDLFEGYLTFEYNKDKKRHLNTNKYGDLSIKTNAGEVYLNESDIIYFLQIKLNQIIHDFQNVQKMTDKINEHCVNKKQEIIVYKEPPSGVPRPAELEALNAAAASAAAASVGNMRFMRDPRCAAEDQQNIERGYSILDRLQYERETELKQRPCHVLGWRTYIDCINDHVRKGDQLSASWYSSPDSHPPYSTYYLNRSESVIDGTNSTNTTHGNKYVRTVGGGMVGQFKYKFNKINDIHRLINTIGMYIRSKNKWG